MTSRAPFSSIVIAVLALAACGGSNANSGNAADANAALNSPAGNEAAAAPPTATAPADALSADYMVGKWSAADEDCSGTLEFRKNGTVTTPIGEAKWTVDAGKLTIDYNDGSAPTTSTIKPLGADRIEITHASGTKETEKRC